MNLIDKLFQTSLNSENTPEKMLYDYVLKQTSILETDIGNRKNGIKKKTGSGYKYAGYDILREFFDGDQWDYAPEGGGSNRVYNFCSATVFNYTAFMTNEAPEFDVPPDEITDPIEVERAERKETILKEIMDDNNFSLQFEAAVQGGSITGDSFLVGPFWSKNDGRIWFSYVKRPENIMPIFSSDDFTKIIGFIWDFYMDIKEVEERYGEQIKARGISLTEEPIGSKLNANSSEQSSQQMVHLQQYWNDQEMLLIAGNKILDYQRHKWGFVPLIFVPNMIHPLKWNGISDLENILDPQQEYNEKNANVSDILDSVAYPTIFGKNIEPFDIPTGKMTKIIDVGSEAELIKDPRVANTFPIEQVIQDRLKDIFNQSGLNEVSYGGAGVKEATGRALSVLMQSVNNRIKGRQERWRIALKQLSANIFKLLETFIPDSRNIINGRYEIDVFFPGTLLRNTVDEINKYTRKLQSRYTTMKNLGVPSPKDEAALIKKEAMDDAQLQIMLQQMLLQSQQAAQQAVEQGQRGTPSSEPTLQEEDGAEEQPAATAGVREQSPISPEGAVNQATQRATGIPNL